MSFKRKRSTSDGSRAAPPGTGILAGPSGCRKSVIRPLADGGEGTTDALIEGLGGKRIDIAVTGPLGAPVSCYYGYLSSTENTGEKTDDKNTATGGVESATAIMEMAAAAGITLTDVRDPLRATTFASGK